MEKCVILVGWAGDRRKYKGQEVWFVHGRDSTSDADLPSNYIKFDIETVLSNREFKSTSGQHVRLVGEFNENTRQRFDLELVSDMMLEDGLTPSMSQVPPVAPNDDQYEALSTPSPSPLLLRPLPPPAATPQSTLSPIPQPFAFPSPHNPSTSTSYSLPASTATGGLSATTSSSSLDPILIHPSALLKSYRSEGPLPAQETFFPVGNYPPRPQPIRRVQRGSPLPAWTPKGPKADREKRAGGGGVERAGGGNGSKKSQPSTTVLKGDGEDQALHLDEHRKESQPRISPTPWPDPSLPLSHSSASSTSSTSSKDTSRPLAAKKSLEVEGKDARIEMDVDEGKTWVNEVETLSGVSGPSHLPTSLLSSSQGFSLLSSSLSLPPSSPSITSPSAPLLPNSLSSFSSSLLHRISFPSNFSATAESNFEYHHLPLSQITPPTPSVPSSLTPTTSTESPAPHFSPAPSPPSALPPSPPNCTPQLYQPKLSGAGWKPRATNSSESNGRYSRVDGSSVRARGPSSRTTRDFKDAVYKVKVDEEMKGLLAEGWTGDVEVEAKKRAKEHTKKVLAQRKEIKKTGGEI